MSRVQHLKRQIEDKQREIDKAMTKMGTCRSEDSPIYEAIIKLMNVERTVLEAELFGDWAPKKGGTDVEEV
jgi:DNA-binding ferritin-like protein (Dps family)